MKEIILNITGITCIACCNAIKRSLLKKDFIYEVEVDLINKQAFITYDENLTTKQNIINHIEKLGFKAQENRDSTNKQYVFAIIFASALFVLSMGSMIFEVKYELLICIIEIILLIPILYCGKEIYKKGFLALLKFFPNMDSLVMLGSGSAIIYSLYMLILYLNGDINSLLHNVYFESAGVIIAVILLGKKIEQKEIKNIKDSLNTLVNLSPKTALKYENNKLITTDIKDINIDDIIAIPNGAMVSIDGILLDEKCELDMSLINGESKKAIKQKNEKIISGSINCSGQFLLKVSAKSKDSTISKIINLSKNIKKAPIARIADIVSAYFVPSVIFIAILASVIWYIQKGDLQFCFIIFTSTLLISCPCALGLATPLSIAIATNKAIKKAIYFKNAEIIEELSKINVIVFDKTGTITTKNLKVINFTQIGNMNTNYLLSCIYALEQKSQHLIAKALIDYTSQKNINKNTIATNIQTIEGSGISGIIDNKLIKIGNATFVGLNKDLDSKNILVYVSIDGIHSATFEIENEIKKNVKKLIKNLDSLKLKSIILSGDTKQSVKKIADICGIKEYHHSQIPSDKLDFISNLQAKNNKVAFIGDGINDALALKKANVGISFDLANDITTKEADLIISNIYSIYDAIMISKKTIQNIKENIAFAFIYNICAIPIATKAIYLFGINISLNPMIAGIAMGLSSLSVVLNAMKLQKNLS